MKPSRGFLFLFLIGVFGVAIALAQEPVQESIPNWPAPATWTPTRPGGVHTLANITSPLPFIGVTPCRVADTRGNGFTGAYGPPSLAANADRSFTITGRCGIPAGAQAVSFNFVALNVGAGGDLRVFPAGAVVPLASTLNYNANTPNIANAAVVPLGEGGAITVQADATSIDLIIDVNGYYGWGSAANLFLGGGSGNPSSTGNYNTGVGASTLTKDNSGQWNTGVGYGALFSNTDGGGNTAVGSQALVANTQGFDNTATGNNALFSNTTGNWNVAVGSSALLMNTTGCCNIAIGLEAGEQTIGDRNIDIGNIGAAGSNTIRIGTVGTHSTTIIAGISGAGSPYGVPVLVSGSGQLGTMTSSRRFKDGIRDLANEGEALMRLRPVAFRYKPQIDAAGLTQYGLIAEEVAEAYPELVTSDREGRPEGVRYHLLAPLLLNEAQKQRLTIESLRAEVEQLKAQLRRLEQRVIAESGSLTLPSSQGGVDLDPSRKVVVTVR